MKNNLATFESNALLIKRILDNHGQAALDVARDRIRIATGERVLSKGLTDLQYLQVKCSLDALLHDLNKI
jgi:hypothetical protein